MEKEIKLIRYEEVDKFKLKDTIEFYKTHYQPGLLSTFKLLGFDKFEIEKAEDCYFYTKGGDKILDFWGGFGVLNLGHNHPAIIKVIKNYIERKKPIVNMSFPFKIASILARNLANISPGELDYVLLYSTGAEAVESALKFAEKYFGPKKNKIIYFSNSFHGKTRAALSATGQYKARKYFNLLDNFIELPYGDIGEIAQFIINRQRKGNKNDIAAVIVEPIQGNGGIIIPPPGYLKRLKEICEKNEILLIIDEIQSGFGRTGKFYAFEYEEIIPDIVVISKSLGGAFVPLSAVIIKKDVFLKNYGNREGSTISSSTFSGLGLSCAIAIEAIDILYKENLMENSKILGNYFIDKLKELQKKYPHIIKDVRGRGLMVGLEFKPFTKDSFLNKFIPDKIIKDKFSGTISIPIAINLLHKYKILTGLTVANMNVLRLLPPLTISKKEIDYFIEALDKLLSKSIVKLYLSAIIK